MPRFSGISHVELTVRDRQHSAAWYERVLGMRRVAEHDQHTTPGVEAGVINLLHPSGVSIGLIAHHAGHNAAFSELHVGLDHLALAVDSRDELEAWAQHLADHGVAHSAITDMSYGSVLAFRDPDEIQLELFVWSGSL